MTDAEIRSIALDAALKICAPGSARYLVEEAECIFHWLKHGPATSVETATLTVVRG